MYNLSISSCTSTSEQVFETTENSDVRKFTNWNCSQIKANHV